MRHLFLSLTLIVSLSSFQLKQPLEDYGNYKNESKKEQAKADTTQLKLSSKLESVVLKAIAQAKELNLHEGEMFIPPYDAEFLDVVPEQIVPVNAFGYQVFFPYASIEYYPEQFTIAFTANPTTGVGTVTFQELTQSGPPQLYWDVFNLPNASVSVTGTYRAIVMDGTVSGTIFPYRYFFNVKVTIGVMDNKLNAMLYFKLIGITGV